MNLRTSSIFLLLGFLALFFSGCQGDDDGRNSGYGTMSVQLSANSSVIEVGASSETRGSLDSIRATRAAVVTPDVNEFKLVLYKGKEIVNQWERFSDFGQNEKIAIGDYTLKASYGNIDAEGLDAACFEGSTVLKIREREETPAEITCNLANVKVTIVCTETLKKYFKSFAMQMRSDIGTDIDISKDETRSVYLKPGLLVLNAQLEKQNGTTSKLELLRISNTTARQHYTIKVEVNGGEAGSGTLNVTYNSVKSEEDVKIDLSDASLNIKEPVFTSQGFTDGITETLREGAEPTAMKVTLNARAGIKTCELTVHAPYLTKELGLSDKITVDLASRDEKQMAVRQQLLDKGLRLIGLTDNLEKLALIDFTKLVMNLLCTGDADELSTFTLRSTDVGGRVEEKELSLNVLMKSNQFSFPEIEEKVMIGSTEASVGIRLLANEGSLSGQTDVENVVFEYKDEAGQWKEAKTKFDGDDWEDGVLHYAIVKNLPEVHTKLKLRARYGSKVSEERTLEYDIPDFTIIADEIDVWPRKATLKVQAKTDIERDAVLKYFKLMNGSAEMSNVTQKGNSFLCENLRAGTTYELVGVCNGEKKIPHRLSTEADVQLPNSDFEGDGNWTEIAYNNGNDINKGGPWSKRGAGFDFSGYTATKTYEEVKLKTKEPNYWTTVNAKTMPANPADKNTWYVVPSTDQVSSVINGYSVKLRNVGWSNDNQGKEIGTLGQAGNFIPKGNCYASFPGFPALNTPPISLNYSAGRLFLGVYRYNHASNEEEYVEGYPFTSRPSAFKFDYIYKSITKGASDKGYVKIMLKSGTTVVAEEDWEISPTDNALSKTLNLNYLFTNKKVTTICVMFCSSIEGKELLQSKESEYIRNKDNTDPTNKGQACSTGSELTIDNIELIY